MAATWAENLLRSCMGIRSGESLLVMVDQPLAAAGESLRIAARSRSASAVYVYHTAERVSPVSVVSEQLLRVIRRSDLIITLLSSLDLSREDLAFRAAMAAFRSEGRGRWGLGACIDPGVLECEFLADFRAVSRIVGKVKAHLLGMDHVRVVTPMGTDLFLRLGGRPLHAENGILKEPGMVGNLPGGEVFAAPLEDSANGRLVVDLSLGDLALPEPITLTFVQGRVVRVEGGAAADALSRRLGADPWAWTVGEFGVGCNPFARIRGRVCTDEKVLGTVHVALGGNRQFGGINPAETHYDCVVSDATLYLDGLPFRPADVTAERP